MGGRGAKALEATNARTIDKMNEAQLNGEIAKNQKEIDRLQKQLNKYQITDEYNGAFPLGVGFRSDRAYVRNIERATRNAEEYAKIYDKIQALQNRNSSYQNALNKIQGTGQTQRERVNARVNEIAKASTTKWKKAKIDGGTSYKSGNWTINNVEGTSFIYRNGERVGMADTLKKAKAFVDIQISRGR